VCRIVGISQSLYGLWLKAGLLPALGPAGLTEREAASLATIHLLTKELGTEAGRMAWEKIKDNFAPDGARDQIDVVYDVARFRTTLAYDDTTLARATRCQRPVQVVSLTDEVTSVVQAFRDQAQIRLRNKVARRPHQRVTQQGQTG
jgi:hypothetical protein